ncbi:MAG: ATP-binding protein, partial [Methanoregula sp.]|nr:ATP-binding protein [Methanoregula sp.]
MFELPLVTVDLVRALILNFTIIATLVLLYNFISDRILSPSKLVHSLGVGIIFGLAAVISIPLLWENVEITTLGFNIILVPLAGFIGGPVSAVFVATVLLAGSGISTGTLYPPEIVTVTSGILLGALFYYARTWPRFPRSYIVQYLLLGIGVVFVELSGFSLSFFTRSSPAPVSGAPPLIDIVPFLLASIGGTIVLGAIITFIDSRKLAERELLDYKDRLEERVKERTTELRQANSLLEATIESTADGIVVVDREDMIRAYNWKASRILDLPARPPAKVPGREVFTKHLSPLVEDPEGFLSLVTPLPESAEQVVTPGLRFKNGRTYELYVHPQRIGDRSVGRVFSLHDITDKRLAEDAITAANNKLMLLSTLTRHDIFNQVTALSAYLELLGMDKRDPVASAHIDAMTKSLEVIRFQLEFTRDYQNLGMKKPDWICVETAFTSASESYAGRNIIFRCETGNAEVFADPMLGQVFYNLMDNSLRHGGGRISEIRLSLRKEDPDLIIAYEDNGVGIPPEEKEKIFIKGYGKHTGLG